MWGMLVMASTVGLLLGLLVSTLTRNWRTVAVVLLLASCRCSRSPGGYGRCQIGLACSSGGRGHADALGV